MNTPLILAGICGVLISAAGCAAPAGRRGSSGEERCALRLKQCVVFWKVDGREFMGGATLDCEEAEKYVARRNEEMGAGSNWFRPIYVNQDVGLARDCASPGELEDSARGVPMTPGVPGMRKEKSPAEEPGP